MATVKMLEYDDGVKNCASFQAPTASGLLAGFVEMTSGSDWTITNSLSSGTKSPIGVITQSATSGTEGIEVRPTGYVWLTMAPTVAGVAGNPVFPAGRGVIGITGATDASGNAILGNRGFGTIIKGASSGSEALVKLERMH
jgi:hypothetical protein